VALRDADARIGAAIDGLPTTKPAVGTRDYPGDSMLAYDAIRGLAAVAAAAADVPTAAGLAASPTFTGTYAKSAATYTVVTTTSGAYPATRPAGAGRVWFDDPAVTPPSWALERDRWASA
jgi:hypothetical protein